MRTTTLRSERTNGVPVPQLARLRKRAGLSQQALAERAGLSISTISRLERGANARYVTIKLLAHALQVPPARLIRPPRQTQSETARVPKR